MSLESEVYHEKRRQTTARMFSRHDIQALFERQVDKWPSIKSGSSPVVNEVRIHHHHQPAKPSSSSVVTYSLLSRSKTHPALVPHETPSPQVPNTTMKFQIITIAAAFMATSAVALPAADVTADSKAVFARAEAADTAADFNFTTDFDGPLNNLFATLEDIPDSVLEAGDDALDKWLVDHGVREPGAKLRRSESDEQPPFVVKARGDGDDDTMSLFERSALQARVSWWKVAKCVASIVQVLATTAIPAAKILRIKKYIEALGGAKQAVELLLKATSRAEKLKAGGEVLVNLAAELMGISSVKNNCF